MPKSSIQSIQDQIKKLQAKADTLKAKNKKPAMSTIVKMMRENDISIEEISDALGKSAGRQKRTNMGGAKKQVKSRKEVPVKYRNPETKETWTGRGRTPRWLAEAEAAGKNRQEFSV